MGLRESGRARVSRSSAQILDGRYRLDGLLGSGGAADVHRGFDLRLGRPVAVKVFRSGTGSDSGENLHGEAMILARLHHPGLVTAYDAGQHNGRAFLVMQLVEGTTLKHFIAEGPLSPETTAAVGADLAQALAHAHDAGIVHRDVKPSNILLDGSRRPYLTDFGISRLLDATTRTATGTLIGTAAYLSPEQVLGRPVGRPADIYALGLVLLECVTGRLEYDGGPLEAAIARLHRKPVLPLSLPKQLSDLLSDMTALDEQTRPTAHECARTLATVAGAVRSESVPSEPATSLIGPREPHGSQGSQGSHDPEGLYGSTQTAGRTHTQPLSRTNQGTPRTMPARSRTLVLGATAALAAVMATALAVTDSSAPPGNDRSSTRATTAPSAETESSDGSRQKEAAATAAPSDRTASAETLSGDGDGDAGQGVRPAPLGPSRHSASGAATTAPATPTGTDTGIDTTQGGASTKRPHKSPNQATKAEKPAEKVQKKKPEKTATER